jgi:hypothetical protein
MLSISKGYNEISVALQKKLDDERVAVGKLAKYKFYIARKNPDGEHKPGEEYLFPALYTLTPVTFSILEEDRKERSIGLYQGTEKHNDDEEIKFGRVTLLERNEGILNLDLSVPEHMHLELHPKNENGFFRDKNIPAMFCRVDELKEAKQRLRSKELRGQAIMVATKMGEGEVRNFAAAMNWNELEDFEILKDRMIEIADKDPEFFRKFVDDPAIEYKAIIRRAIDANVINWIPVEAKFIWSSNGSTIAMIDRSSVDKYLDGFSDWLMTAKNGLEVYKKIRTLLTGKA